METNKHPLLFYSLWRNLYIRKLIRLRQFQDSTIKVTLSFLNDNHKYLSEFTEKDKLDYNILILLYIRDRRQFIDYHDHPHANIINSITIDDCVDISQPPQTTNQQQQEEDKDKEKEKQYDSNKRIKISTDHYKIVCEGVHKLLIHVSEENVKKQEVFGTLPDSITDLTFNTLFEEEEEAIKHRFIDRILLNLPKNLIRLEIPDEYEPSFKETVVLPLSLCKFKKAVDFENINKYQQISSNGQSNNGFDDFKVKVKKIDQLHQLQSKPNITQIEIFKIPFTITQLLLPSHIKKLSLHKKIQVEIESLPKCLEVLVSKSYIPIRSGPLPPNLKTLAFFKLKEPLVKGTLPNSLKILCIKKYNQPLEPGVLPPHLVSLYLGKFDKNIRVGVLPLSLKHLQLPSFDRQLLPNVLPNGIREIGMDSFNHRLGSNILPKSLVFVKLLGFERSLSDLGGMDRLKQLCVQNIGASLRKLITPKVKKLHLAFSLINGKSIDLSDSNIHDLFIESLEDNVSLEAFKLPKVLKRLKTNGLRIESKNLIPYGCETLITDIQNLNPQFIPQSVKSNIYYDDEFDNDEDGTSENPFEVCASIIENDDEEDAFAVYQELFGSDAHLNFDEDSNEEFDSDSNNNDEDELDGISEYPFEECAGIIENDDEEDALAMYEEIFDSDSDLTYSFDYDDYNEDSD
ncbi:hypothetical protein CYY_002143 [Polysphondylium violaceum]|uniref:Uncharacterized protein n=1 Tax=Polysphondylium violaceum TaxID=133409 RepID=A0A8J4V9W3_9MYCE|nr:hypothetical protein CYY_002143 [Polysphondylium violaceum]